MRQSTADTHSITRPAPAQNPQLPATPLIQAVCQRGGLRQLLPSGERDQEACRLQRAYHRATQRGWVTYAMADELACRLLRRHPAELWGPAFWDGAS